MDGDCAIRTLAGMTSANMCLTTIKVELEEGDELKEPEQHLDDGEFIEKRIVAVKDLYRTLVGEAATLIVAQRGLGEQAT